LLNCIKKLNAENITLSVNDVSDGGLFICLAESAFYSESGFEINCPDNIRKDAFLFGESSGRIVVTVEENNIENLILTAKNFNVDCFMLGKTGGSNFIVDQTDFGSVDSFKTKYFESLENKIQDLKS
jgi:phosphoribosylformylglycinamidine synthase